MKVFNALMLPVAVVLKVALAEEHLSYDYGGGRPGKTGKVGGVAMDDEGDSMSGTGVMFYPTGDFRCIQFSCWRGHQNIFQSDETQTWSYNGDGMYVNYGHENVVAGVETYNQSFTMYQYGHDPMHFEGVVHDRHQTPPNVPPGYHNGYPLDYKPPGDGDGIPDWYYEPPVGQLEVWFTDADNYQAIGHWSKPNGPHSCIFPECTRIGS